MTQGICQIIPTGWSHKTYDPDPEPWLLSRPEPNRRDRSDTDAERWEQWLIGGLLEPCEVPEVVALIKRFEKMSDAAWQCFMQEMNPIGILKNCGLCPEDLEKKYLYQKRRKATIRAKERGCIL